MRWDKWVVLALTLTSYVTLLTTVTTILLHDAVQPRAAALRPMHLRQRFAVPSHSTSFALTLLRRHYTITNYTTASRLHALVHSNWVRTGTLLGCTWQGADGFVNASASQPVPSEMCSCTRSAFLQHHVSHPPMFTHTTT